MASGNWRLAFGTFIGCILAFVFLPPMLLIKRKLKKKNEESRLT